VFGSGSIWTGTKNSRSGLNSGLSWWSGVRRRRRLRGSGLPRGGAVREADFDGGAPAWLFSGGLSFPAGGIQPFGNRSASQTRAATASGYSIPFTRRRTPPA
jgi:hypothetical protein